jgi:hypothetical protein
MQFHSISKPKDPVQLNLRNTDKKFLDDVHKANEKEFLVLFSFFLQIKTEK